MASKKGKRAPPGVSERVYRVYKALSPKPKELLGAKNPPRMFIREGELYQWRPKEHRVKRKYLFLFDDLLVVARRDSRTSYGTKIIMRIGPGTSLKCALVADSSYYIKGVEFRLWNRARMFVFFGKDPANALSWVRDIVYVMNGGRLPYRPIIDPITGEERDAEGERKDQELLRRIQQLKDQGAPANTPEMERMSGKDLLGGHDDDWSGFSSGGGAGAGMDLLTADVGHGAQPRQGQVMQPSAHGHGSGAGPSGQHGHLSGQHPQQHQAGYGPGASSSSAQAHAASAPPGGEQLLPYNPFLSVGSNPFDPFSTGQQQAQQPADWETLLERAAIGLCMMGKTVIMDLEQMHAMDNNLVEAGVLNLAKKTKSAFETLYGSAAALNAENDPERRKEQAQNLAKVARDVLPSIRNFSAAADKGVDSVQDDFARGRQRYLLQGLNRDINNFAELLPPENGANAQQVQAQPEAGHVEIALQKVIQSLESTVASFQGPKAGEEAVSIGGNTKVLGLQLAELLRVATDAEKSLGELHRQNGQVYHRNPAWEEGLISAAKAVLHNVNLLASFARSVENASPAEKEFECDSLLAAVRALNGAFSQLVMSARVKIPPESVHAANLETAASRVKLGSSNLEQATLQEALKFRKQADQQAGPKSGVGAEKKKIEAMSKVARLERELEEARKQISTLNSAEYKN